MILDKSLILGNITIFSFLKAICKSTIYFVLKGTTINKKYTALWPDKDFIRERAVKVLNATTTKNDISPRDIQALEKYSIRLIELVKSIRLKEYRSDDLLHRIEELEKDFTSFCKGLDRDWVNSTKWIDLSDFENSISIVFHNTECQNSENVLFTGDISNSKIIWRKIWPLMHPYYHAIKVPHHGTDRYYTSFVNYIDAESTLMIPNGYVNRRGWGISLKYSVNANYKNSRVVCSSNDQCKAHILCKNCFCIKRQTLAQTGQVYFDI